MPQTTRRSLMNIKSSARTAGIFAATVTVALLNIQRSSATDLTFDGTSGPVNQSYGDRVTSTTMGAFSYGEHGEDFTPNITVQYDPNSGAAYTWPSGYGDLIRTLYESVSTAKLQLKLS